MSVHKKTFVSGNRVPHVFWHASLFVLLILSFFYFDRPIASFFHEHPWSFVRYFSYFGDGVVYIILFAGLTALFGFLKPQSPWRKRCMILFVGLIIPYAICLVLKVLLGRARPELWFSDHLFGFFGLATQRPYWSFPSGHTTTWMAIAMGLALIYPRLRTWFVSFGLLIALSRVVSTDHYLSDVLASAYLVGIEFVLMRKVLLK